MSRKSRRAQPARAVTLFDVLGSNDPATMLEHGLRLNEQAVKREVTIVIRFHANIPLEPGAWEVNAGDCTFDEFSKALNLGHEYMAEQMVKAKARADQPPAPPVEEPPVTE